MISPKYSVNRHTSVWRSLFPMECPCIKTSKRWWPPSPPGIYVAQHAAEAVLTRGTTGARRLSQWDQENGKTRGWGIARVKVSSHQKYTSDAAGRPFAATSSPRYPPFHSPLLSTPRFSPLPYSLGKRNNDWPALFQSICLFFSHPSPICLFFFPAAGSQLNVAAFL